MLSGFLAFLVKLGFGGIVEKAFDHIERRAELANDKERVKAKATVELAREAVNEAKVMAEFNTRKLSFPWFWVFAGLFIFPLGLWWAAVIVDSIPYLRDVFGDQQVSDLPTPQMQEWAGRMISWLFFVGTGAGAIRYAAGK